MGFVDLYKEAWGRNFSVTPKIDLYSFAALSASRKDYYRSIFNHFIVLLYSFSMTHKKEDLSGIVPFDSEALEDQTGLVKFLKFLEIQFGLALPNPYEGAGSVQLHKDLCFFKDLIASVDAGYDSGVEKLPSLQSDKKLYAYAKELCSDSLLSG